MVQSEFPPRRFPFLNDSLPTHFIRTRSPSLHTRTAHLDHVRLEVVEAGLQRLGGAPRLRVLPRLLHRADRVGALRVLPNLDVVLRAQVSYFVPF